MKTTLKFVGLAAFDHHKDLVRDLVTDSIEKFDLHSKFRSIVTIRKISTKFSPSSELYECELNLYGGFNCGHLFFKKNGHSLIESARSTLLAAEKALRRESKTRQSRMRKNYYKVNRQLELAA